MAPGNANYLAIPFGLFFLTRSEEISFLYLEGKNLANHNVEENKSCPCLIPNLDLIHLFSDLSFPVFSIQILC